MINNFYEDVQVALLIVFGTNKTSVKFSNRVVYKHTDLVIMAIEALLYENQKSNNNMFPKVLNLKPQPFRSNALLSELSRHVLFGISFNI